MAQNPDLTLPYLRPQSVDHVWTPEQLVRDFEKMQFVFDQYIRYMPFVLGTNVTPGTVTGINAGANLQTVSFPSKLVPAGGGIRIAAKGTVAGTVDTKVISLLVKGMTLGSISFAAGETGLWIFQAWSWNTSDEITQDGFLLTSKIAGSSPTMTTLGATGIDYRTLGAATATKASIFVRTRAAVNGAGDTVTGHILSVEFVPQRDATQ